jgi:hypothetical protein
MRPAWPEWKKEDVAMDLFRPHKPRAGISEKAEARQRSRDGSRKAESHASWWNLQSPHIRS